MGDNSEEHLHQILLEQQKQEELLRLQQTALVEKQREEDELFRLQQEALIEKNREDDIMQQMRLGVVGPPPPPPSTMEMVINGSPSSQPRILPTNVAMPLPPGMELTQTSMQPPMQSQMQPPMQSQMQTPMQSQMQPPMQSQMQPPMQHQMQPPMQPQMQPPMQPQMQPPMQPPMQPHMQPPMQPPMQPQMQPSMGPPGVDLDEEGGINEVPSLLTLRVDAPEDDGKEMKLPMALEQALAFKSERAKQLGVHPEDDVSLPKPDVPDAPPAPVISTRGLGHIYDDDEDDEDDDIAPPPPSLVTGQSDQEKQKKKAPRRKKKNKKKKRRQLEQTKKEDEDQTKKEETKEKEPVEIEYVQEILTVQDLEPMYRQFARIFENFRIVEADKNDDSSKDQISKEPAKEVNLKKVPKLDDEFDDDLEEKKEDDKVKLSKRKLKKLTRLSVAELKQLVNRPDVVEMHDVTAKDPKLLVQLKAHRNTVSVPRHWCFKRKYLQGKRGIEKPPFDLPDFIKKTGIMEMRAALQEKEDQRTLKAKMRERARPKLGKIDIDYQKLHDAFFKWQTKPRMSIHGDLYYEGKEFETRLKEKKPGDLTDELRTALGMPTGPSSHKVPPPWLIAMQRYGPPPSYPNLKIPGLNAPIPDGCSFGYHAGGWGKPPVDETGRPLYGDVFGMQGQDFHLSNEDEDVDQTLWGELESESEEESEEEEEEEEEEEQKEDETGLVTPAEGLITPSGITSIPAGMETPEIIELRKRKIESEMEGGETPALYQVLPEKRVERVGGAMMASTHIYDMTAANAQPPPGGPPPRRGTEGPGTVELALDPSELDLVDTEAMAVRYEQQIREQQSQLQKEDLSDMLADHVARQKNKRKQRQQHQDSKQAKKYKEFKF